MFPSAHFHWLSFWSKNLFLNQALHAQFVLQHKIVQYIIASMSQTVLFYLEVNGKFPEDTKTNNIHIIKAAKTW